MRKPLQKASVLAILLLAFLLLAGNAAYAAQYTREAVLKDGAAYPGVYYITAHKGDSGASLGIPSISKQNLEGGPTTESPAIIMGGAVPYEKRVGPMEFEKISGGSYYPPYNYFKCTFIEEANQDGKPGTHKKASGFDGSYVIVRVDVSELIADAPEGSFLHVKQTGNKALMATLLHEGWTDATGYATFADALGNKVGVYSLANGAVSMKDKEGNDTETPYIDLIIYSSGTHVAGADTGSTDPNVANADFSLKFYVDQTNDYDPSLIYDPNAASPTDPNAPTMDQKMLAKYFSDSAQDVTSYTVKGSDLELEIMADASSKREYWSLRKALAHRAYDGVPIRLICEVSVLEGLVVEGEDRHVIFDVHSFDIQIANHQSTGAAALTVKNATLELTDSFKTTGAELAVGNNATMSIQKGGTLIVDDKCQLEVEYDAASTTADSGTTAPDYSVGVLTVEDGGTIINRGVITVEGTEGKPIDPAAPSVRSIKDAEFHIEAGGKLVNEGCLLSYGKLYNMGTIENTGKYNDTITSQDPDKGTFTYHKGIQISWKDDVTQDSVFMGSLFNGGDDMGAQETSATVINSGDIVLVPGMMDNYGLVENTADGRIYLCAVKEAVIPITATPDKPTVLEKRIAFGKPFKSYWTNYEEGRLENAGKIIAAKVEIVSNGRTGALTALSDGDELFTDLTLENFGNAVNSGAITVDAVRNFGTMTNEGAGAIVPRVLLNSNSDGVPGVLTDTADKKLTSVFNGALTTDTGADVWTYTPCSELTITPHTQDSYGGKTVNWTVRADTAEPCEGVRYRLELHPVNQPGVLTTYEIPANEDTVVTSSELPTITKNVVYSLHLTDNSSQSEIQYVAVNITSDPVIVPPAPIGDLVYNGKDQTLTTTGSMAGQMVYRLGEDGDWSEAVPTAKNAGTYSVYYKLQEQTASSHEPVTVMIGKRAATVSADDVASKKGDELKALSWTVSGLVEGDTLKSEDVTVSTAADPGTVGESPIVVTVSGEYPNYEFTARNGIYTVTETEFNVTAKDKHGVYSDDVTYAGFNIELTVPAGATAYYSTETELTQENYQTAGVTALKFLPAGAGTHTVYYYVTDADGTNVVRGSKQVIIDKAEQTAPANLETEPETYLNSGDGRIIGLTPRTMEYRDIGNDGTYETVYDSIIYVVPGTYLVRKAADENHFASPDTKVEVKAGGVITVYFDSNSGSAVSEVTDLACGDPVPQPEDPTLPGAKFLGWFFDKKLYDFNSPVARDMVLTAGWAPETIGFMLPTDTKTIEAGAFAGIGAVSIGIPDGCATIGAEAFKGCKNLRQIVIPASVTTIDPTAFDECSGLYVFGASASAADTICEGNEGLTLVYDAN